MRDKTWTTIWNKVETIYTANILSCINDAPAVFRTLFRQGDSFDFFFLFNKNSWTEHRWIREKIFFFTIEKDRWSNSKNLFYFSRRRRFFYHWLYALDFSFFFQMIWSRLKTIYREFITFLIERKYQYVLYIFSKRRIIITRNHFYDNKQLLCMYANRKVARSFPYTIKNNAIRMRYN